MMRVGVIEGNGIGPELIRATKRVLNSTGLEIEWVDIPVGDAAFEAYGHPLPPESVMALKKAGILLKGPMAVERCKGRFTCVHEDGSEHVYPSINNAIRRELGLFVAPRPIRGFPAISGKFAELDVVVMREITEGIYAGIEFQISEEIAQAIKVTTRKAVERLAHYSFRYARQHQRRKVTCVHKANALSVTDGLFLRTFLDVARQYPDVPHDDCFVDAAAFNLVKNPGKFDVIVTDNQYGDILSDLAGGLAGSLGVAPGANIGEDVAMFEATHGSAPDIAGKGICNPVSLVLSGAALLKHVGCVAEAAMVERGVFQALSQTAVLTPDLGGQATTDQLVDEIIKGMRQRP